ncbi:MAG: hypothetical protein V2A34_09285 [Lentisphaerota bacterium]
MNKALLMPSSAVLAAVAGVLLSLHSLRTTPENLRILERKTADLRDLSSLEKLAGDDQGAIAEFEKIADHPPATMADIARKAQWSSPPDVRLRDGAPTISGWTVRAAEISMNSVRFTDLSRFILAAESERPPWQLRECTLSASGQGEGTARATLIMEALEKKRP